jgi:DNA-binding LacI/PurR family transcriptional regulator
MTEGRLTSGRRGRATLADVAAYAGVSPSTVSRVVRNATPVSAELEQAVHEAIAVTGYVPNLTARQLVTTRSDTVGMVIAEDQRRVFGEPFFGALMHGVVETLTATRFHVVVVVARSAHDRVWLGHYVAGGHLDGVMLIAPPKGDPLAATLSRLGVPMVYAGRPFGVTDCTFVDIDNAGGAAQAVRHLYDIGRRRIAMVTGIPAMRSSTDRLRGYKKGLTSVGLAPNGDLVIASDYTEAGGFAATQHLLAQGTPFDAVVAASDLVAAGALRALKQAGRTVPGDVALIGFGDEGDAPARYDPPLTTVSQPTVEMGSQLARLTVNAIEGRDDRKSVIMPTQIVIRSSA